jgi:hypothetical protein
MEFLDSSNDLKMQLFHLVLTLKKCIPLTFAIFQQQHDMSLVEFVNDNFKLNDLEYLDVFLNRA